MNQHFRDRILTLLREHGLLDTLSDETLRDLSQATSLAGILGTLFPERYVWFDAECVYWDNIFEGLMGRFTRATLGEWTPEHLHAAIVQGTALIDFDAPGEHIHWEFEQQSKWVSGDFTDAVAAFAETHLSGTFLEMPVADQCYHAVYLPKAVAAALEAILEESRQRWPTSDELLPLLRDILHDKPWLWHVIQTEGNDFALVNATTTEGDLPLHIVVEAACKDRRALRILKHLLRKGASPTLADGRGRTASDVAAGNAAVLAVLQEAVDHQGYVRLGSQDWL